MKQAPCFDCFLFDDFSLPENGFVPSKIDISRNYVVQVLVVPMMIAMVDEGLDMPFQISGQKVVF